MHPIVKVIILLVICQVLQLAYEMRDTHKLHGAGLFWYWLKFTPLIIAVAVLCLLTARLLNVHFWFVV